MSRITKPNKEFFHFQVPSAVKEWYKERATTMGVSASYFVLQVLYEYIQDDTGFDPFKRSEGDLNAKQNDLIDKQLCYEAARDELHRQKLDFFDASDIESVSI